MTMVPIQRDPFPIKNAFTAKMLNTYEIKVEANVASETYK